MRCLLAVSVPGEALQALWDMLLVSLVLAAVVALGTAPTIASTANPPASSVSSLGSFDQAGPWLLSVVAALAASLTSNGIAVRIPGRT